jgi:hypothetical protein
MEKPKCKLIGEDGNVFAIIGKVCKTLRECGLNEEAETFKKSSFECASYDEVLQLLHDYVDVE